MLDENELVAHLKSRFDAKVVILYGSAVRGDVRPGSDVDLVCFVSADERYPDLYLWRNHLLDVCVHPLRDSETPGNFLILHGGRVLLDYEAVGRTLLARVAAEISAKKPGLDPRHERHRRAWVWKMFDRAVRGGVAGDHRRHWLLFDLPETWCDLTHRYYSGPSDAFAQMRERTPETFAAVEEAMKPEASIAELERAVIAVVGERENTDRPD